MTPSALQAKRTKQNRDGWLFNLRTRWQLYVLAALPILYLIIFKLWPLYGTIIAFQDFSPHLGILHSPWAGLKHFIRFLTLFQFKRIFLNTLWISCYTILLCFPIPILLALSLNYIDNKRFKKIAQTITFAPHFISTVVVAGMLIQFLHPKMGIVNQLIILFGGQPASFLSKSGSFATIYALSEMWQHAGWNSIVFLAALTGVSHELHESAVIDGATKVQRALHIDIPTILPTIVIMLIISMGDVLGVGFEKVYLLQNNLNLSASEIIPTYVYKVGVIAELPNHSYSAAIGLFNSVISIIMVAIANQVAKKVTETSLW